MIAQIIVPIAAYREQRDLIVDRILKGHGGSYTLTVTYIDWDGDEWRAVPEGKSRFVQVEVIA